ncbi:MAG: hypothetical protein ACREN8_11210 [Candidatus Dormibacteraceae bacterium]
MSENAYEISGDDGQDLSRLAVGAMGGNIIYLTRHGQRVAAVVSAGVAAAGAAAIEAYEDAEDARIGMEAHAEWEDSGRVSYPLREVLAELETAIPSAGRRLANSI